MIRYIFTYSFLIIFGSTVLDAESQKDGFIPLFNGENLDGWYITLKNQGRTAVDDQDVFTVTDGIIHIYRNKREGSPQPFGALITTESTTGYVAYCVILLLHVEWGGQSTKKASRIAAPIRFRATSALRVQNCGNQVGRYILQLLMLRVSQ